MFMLLFPCDPCDVFTGRVRVSAGLAAGSWAQIRLEGHVVICGEVDASRWSSSSCATADVLMWTGCRAKPVLAGSGSPIVSIVPRSDVAAASTVVVELDDPSSARGVEARLWVTQMVRELLQDRVVEEGTVWRFDGGPVLGIMSLTGNGRVVRKTEVLLAAENRKTKRFKVGGLESVCKMLRETVLHGDGLLLKGPPGTGKTAAVQSVCEEENVPLFYVHGTCTVAQLTTAFSEANRVVQSRAAPLAAVFVDETDVLQRRLELRFFELLDGRMRGVSVLGATNGQVVDSIRRPGRFDREILVGVPTLAARREIVAIHVKDQRIDLEELAQRTVGYVGADLVAVARELKLGKSLDEALALIGPSPMRGARVEVPRVAWDDIGGLEDVKGCCCFVCCRSNFVFHSAFLNRAASSRC
jgi:hypothetical protein